VATEFCRRAGVENPIVAFSHCRDVVAAVTQAGGMGVLGAAHFTPAELEVELSWIDDQVNGLPYGVDVLVPALGVGDDDSSGTPDLASQIPQEYWNFVEHLAERYEVPPATGGAEPVEFSGIVVSRRNLDEQVEVTLRHPVRFLVSGLGPFPAEIVQRAKAKDVLIGGMSGSVKHAHRHVAAGADVIIAQGAEAGGHTGETSTLVLVPQVVDAVAPVPVLAAGGIATGRQLAAVLALGAQGAWMGSTWLTTHESDANPILVDKMLAAQSTQTIRTRCVTGKPVRLLRTEFEEAWAAPDAPKPLPAPLQGTLVRPLITRIFQNKVTPLMGHPVGQAVGLMNKRQTCRAVVEELMTGLVESLEQLRSELGVDD